jgi:hypothetical protein
VTLRAPHLHAALRCFCLAAFARMGAASEGGGDVPFVVEAHAPTGGPALYEYRPLIRDAVRAEAPRLVRLPDAALALEELRRAPSAVALSGSRLAEAPAQERALYRAILLPVLIRTAERCGSFDWSDAIYDQVYLELERSLFDGTRTYAAMTPLVGLELRSPVELSPSVRARPAEPTELDAHWLAAPLPQAGEIAPRRFGRVPERSAVLELARTTPTKRTAQQDAAAELADVVTALRLATGAAVAAGPVFFEQVDWHPLGVRPLLGIAAAEPAGRPARLDRFHGQLARDLLARIAEVEADPELAEALERWELSLFEGEPSRSQRLRESLTALLGAGDGDWAAAMRGAVLLGETATDRDALAATLRGLARGDRAGEGAAAAVRRALVETLLRGQRRRLVDELDNAMLGLRLHLAGRAPPPDASGAAPGVAAAG